MASNEERFHLIQKEYRKKFLVLQKKLEREYGNISSKLMEKVQRVAFDYASTDGLFLKSQRKQILQEIEAINYWFMNEMKDWLEENIEKSADLAIKGQDVASEYYIRSLIQEAAGKDKSILRRALTDGKEGVLLRAKYGSGLAKKIRDTIWKKRWDDGFTLSDRIWKLDQIMNKNIKHMVEDCVNEGKSAVNFAKAVEQYLEVPGPAWTTGIKPSVTGRGSVKYNALRLARTETNQAYHRAQNISDKESIIVKGTKWNLSSSHPNYTSPSLRYKGYPEICDYRAKADHHGLGTGVYPAGEAPADHSLGLCYLTSVLKNKDEIAKALEKKYGEKVPLDSIDNNGEEWYNKDVKEAYDKAVKNEPVITKDLKEISNKTGTEMIGLGHRLKSKDSYLRKIKTDSINMDHDSLKTAALNMHDIIRYTYQDSAESLVDSYKSIVKELKHKGYTELKVKNYWLNRSNPYNGVNAIFKAPSGQTFEVQFHTPESFKLKDEEMHRLYEEFRANNISAEKKAELTEEMFELSSGLEKPEAIDEINGRG